MWSSTNPRAGGLQWRGSGKKHFPGFVKIKGTRGGFFSVEFWPPFVLVLCVFNCMVVKAWLSFLIWKKKWCLPQVEFDDPMQFER